MANKSQSSHLPDELITEFLSWLPVKSLMRFRCVCKSWNTLFTSESDTTFIELHLHRSALRGPCFFLQRNGFLSRRPDFCVAHFSELVLVEKPCPSLRYRSNGSGPYYRAVGSCNGLICLYGYYLKDEFEYGRLYIWNPATRLISEKLGTFRFSNDFTDDLRLSFGYDPLTDTYKVVRYVTIRFTNRVSVFTLGGYVWLDIHRFRKSLCTVVSEGVHLNDTIYWIATRRVIDGQGVTIDQYVILSLDLTTTEERNTLFTPPPPAFKKVLGDMPSIRVLMDCLCFCHDLEKTHFVIWQMKEFGVAESWSQLLKFSYQDLQIDPLDGCCFADGLPLCLLSLSDKVMLAVSKDGHVIFYNRSSNTVERTTITNKYGWLSALGFVESLVSPY